MKENNMFTPEQVQKHATTPLKALNISIKKHEWLVGIGKEELLSYIEDGIQDDEATCGLCVFYGPYGLCNGNNRGACPLYVLQDCGCGQGQYENTTTALDIFLDNPTQANLRKFHTQERKMVKLLKSLKGKTK